MQGNVEVEPEYRFKQARIYYTLPRRKGEDDSNRDYRELDDGDEEPHDLTVGIFKKIFHQPD